MNPGFWQRFYERQERKQHVWFDIVAVDTGIIDVAPAVPS